MYVTAVSHAIDNTTGGGLSGEGNFDLAAPMDVDNDFPTGGNGMGTVHHDAPDGTVVVAHLTLQEHHSGPGGPDACDIKGTAIGG